MPITVQHSVIKSVNDLVKYKIFQEGGRRHYHVGIWVEGTSEELSNIISVEYKLHPSFAKQIRKSENRRNKFSVTIWTWGIFQIEVTCSLKDASSLVLKHNLEYQLPNDISQFEEV
jgi:transcription initiation factor IIF auxiliary subunit